MNIESFVITNGRSTCDYAIKSIEEQSVKVKITVIRDMKWIDAVNRCVQLCSTKFFIRVDDDMFLHPRCVEYMYHQIIKHKKTNRVAAYVCKLWEDWQSYVAGSIKVYHMDRVKDMGGFKVNLMGKIDKPFEAQRKKNKFIVVKDASVVGVHGMGTWKEQKEYRKLWLQNNSKVQYIRPRKYLANQKKYKKSACQQYMIAKGLRKINKRRRSGFWNLIKDKKR